MRIAEMQRLTGASARMLRHYEARGLLSPRRGPNGYRDYTPQDVLAVQDIRCLLDAGLSTETAGQVLSMGCGDLRAGATAEQRQHVLDIIDAHLSRVRQERAALASTASLLGGLRRELTAPMGTGPRA